MLNSCLAFPHLSVLLSLSTPKLGTAIDSGADFFSGYCEARNCDSLYVCGPDEYGTAIQRKAIKEVFLHHEISCKYYQINTDMFRYLDDFAHSAPQKQGGKRTRWIWPTAVAITQIWLNNLHCLVKRFIQRKYPSIPTDYSKATSDITNQTPIRRMDRFKVRPLDG